MKKQIVCDQFVEGAAADACRKSLERIRSLQLSDSSCSRPPLRRFARRHEGLRQSQKFLAAEKTATPQSTSFSFSLNSKKKGVSTGAQSNTLVQREIFLTTPGQACIKDVGDNSARLHIYLL